MHKLATLLAMALLLSPLLAVCAVATSEPATFTFAIVQNPVPEDRLNLRTKPEKTAESLGKYYSGTKVQILETVDAEWVHVRIGYTDSGYLDGYMMRAYLVFPDSTNAVEPAFPMMRCMEAGGFLLYTEPNLSARSVEYSSSGEAWFQVTDVITVLGNLPNGWSHVSILGYDWENPRADKDGAVIFTGFIEQDQLSPLRDNLGLVSKTSIEYDQNAQHPFSMEALDAATDVIKQRFEASYVGCEMSRLWYNEAQSDEFLRNEPHMQISSDYVVFLSDFNCITGYQATGFETGQIIKGWTWFLHREDNNSEWQIINWGLF